MYIVGHLALDCIICDTKQSAYFDVPGGAALGAACGASLWADDVSIVSVCGHDYPCEVLSTLQLNSISTEYVVKKEIKSLKFWILENDLVKYVSSPTNNFKDATPEISTALSTGYIDRVQICPMPFSCQLKIAKEIKERNKDCLILLDILPVTFSGVKSDNIDVMFETLKYVDFFCPSYSDAVEISGSEDPYELFRCLNGYDLLCSIIKCGDRGVVFGEKHSNPQSYCANIASNVVEASGAGDAFCGGFLAAYSKSRNIFEAIQCATVSASLIIEDVGKLSPLGKRKEAALRKKRLEK